MAVPNRPSPGQPIESTWGGAAHDTSVGVVGVVAAMSVAYNSNTAAPADLTHVHEGKASMADLANDCLVAPVDGIYEVWCYFSATGYTGGAYRFDFQFAPTATGSYTNDGAGGSAPGISATARGYASHVRSLVAGNAMRIQIAAPSGGSGTQSFQIQKFGMRLVGHGWAP